MFRNNTNIIGFLQKKQFFNRSPSPSPSHNSRFATNPVQQSKNLTPPRSTKYETNKSIAKTTPNNRNIFELSREQSGMGGSESTHKQGDAVVDQPSPMANHSTRTF
jgi:hypothetical protein